MKQSLVKSTIILSIASLISKILGSIFRIPLQNIAGDEVFGIFSLVYPVYMVALILSVAGIPMAISQLLTEARIKQNNGHNGPGSDLKYIFGVVQTAKWLTLAFGIISFLVIITFSTQLSLALGGTSTRPALIIVSLTLLIAPYMAVYRGYFQGYEDMMPTAFSQVLEQFVRVVIILLLAIMLVHQSFSYSVIAGGIMWGSPLGALISLFYLKYQYSRHQFKSYKHSFSWSDFYLLARKILSVSLPISVGAITMALFNVIDSLTIPSSLQLAGITKSHIPFLYGIYSRGQTLVQIATVFPSSIILPLIPLLTKHKINGELDNVQGLVEKSYRVTHLISWPLGIGLFVLSDILNVALFQNAQGTLVLSIIHLSSIFASLTILGTGILQGLYKAKLGAIIIICSVFFKALLNVVGVNWLGLTGAALATLIIYFLLFMVNTIVIYCMTSFKVAYISIFKIVAASLFMGGVIRFSLLFINGQSVGRLFALFICAIMAGIGVLVYLMILLLIKGISQSDFASIPYFKRFCKKR